MKRKLRTQLSAGFVLIVLITIVLISLAANLLINRQFEKYVAAQQKSFSDHLAETLSYQYQPAADSWNTEYIHGTGMYALNDGYIIKLYDRNGDTVWDAENHDMTNCHQVMNNITVLMQERRRDLSGQFVVHEYDLVRDGMMIGKLDVSYYSPYYLNENAFRFLDSLNRILLIIALFSVAGAAFVAVVLAKRISAPIVKSIQTARQISDGNYSIRFEAKTQTFELLELARTINQMAASLEEQENLRKRLTTDVAHELRTPLANVASHLEAILEGVWEPTAERLRSCYEEVLRIARLVADLQRLSQAESENLKLEIEPVELLKLAGLAAAGFEQELTAKQLSCSVTGAPVMILADKTRIRQVAENLLSNAIKYTGDGGMIELHVSETPDFGILTVTDTGIGISAAEQSLIFERFYRTDKSRNRKTGGAGIGLTIVKSIVQAHGGNIKVDSETGRGSRFTVRLPKSSHPARGGGLPY